MLGGLPKSTRRAGKLLSLASGLFYSTDFTALCKTYQTLSGASRLQIRGPFRLSFLVLGAEFNSTGTFSLVVDGVTVYPSGSVWTTAGVMGAPGGTVVVSPESYIEGESLDLTTTGDRIYYSAEIYK